MEDERDVGDTTTLSPLYDVSNNTNIKKYNENKHILNIMYLRKD